MPHEVLALISAFGVPQVIVLGVAFWHFDRRLIKIEQIVRDWSEK